MTNEDQQLRKFAEVVGGTVEIRISDGQQVVVLRKGDCAIVVGGADGLTQLTIMYAGQVLEAAPFSRWLNLSPVEIVQCASDSLDVLLECANETLDIKDGLPEPSDILT